MTHPLLAFGLQIRIVHEPRIRIRRRLLLFLRHQICCNVLRILRSQPQAGHYSHVLHLQFVAVVGALAVVEIKFIRKTFLSVILGADVFFFVRAIWASALAGEIFYMVLWIYFYAIILYALLSMIAPSGYSPLQSVLATLCEPVLRPIRRAIPSLAGLDLSPLWAGLLIQILIHLPLLF